MGGGNRTEDDVVLPILRREDRTGQDRYFSILQRDAAPQSRAEELAVPVPKIDHSLTYLAWCRLSFSGEPFRHREKVEDDPLYEGPLHLAAVQGPFRHIAPHSTALCTALFSNTRKKCGRQQTTPRSTEPKPPQYSTVPF